MSEKCGHTVMEKQLYPGDDWAFLCPRCGSPMEPLRAIRMILGWNLTAEAKVHRLRAMFDIWECTNEGGAE